MRILIAALVVAAAGLGALGWYFKTEADRSAVECTTLRSDLEREQQSRHGLEEKSGSILAEKNQEIQRLTQKALELEELQLTAKALRDELAAKTELARTAQEKAEQLAAAVGTAAQEREKALQDLAQLRTDQDELVARFAAARTAGERAAADLQKAIDEKTVLAQRAAQAETECDNLKKELEKLHGPAPAVAGAEIEGLIEQDVGDGKVILSNLSRKPEVDLEFSVFRGGEFIGRVKISKAFENYASARVTYLPPGKEVMAGDIVTTSFPEKQ
ncbi:MAG TPA: hypothetical protein DCM87_13485 [Planctomycetes bacterium]|nr:hypothetical protein [Planctomycetota bacterium]